MVEVLGFFVDAGREVSCFPCAGDNCSFVHKREVLRILQLRHCDISSKTYESYTRQ